MNERSRQAEKFVRASIVVLFFLSGATSLAYQGIWFRRFTATWGSSNLAMAAVVSSFLVGLALGAYVAGKLARRIGNPLLWYGILEVCIGLWALLVPSLILWVSDTGLGTLSGLSSSSLLLFAFRVIIAFLIIGFPCICMGATLPLLVDFRCRERDSIGRATALLYGMNTLGASVGCYVTGFHLLPALGSVATNLTTALANAAIGVGAIVVSTRWSFSRIQSVPIGLEPEVSRHSRLPDSVAWVCAASAMTGWSALTLEMVWARQLATVLGGSTYVFTATLCVVLLGIAIGSLLYNLTERFAGTSERLFELSACVIVGTCSLAVAGQVLIPSMCQVTGALRDLRASDVSNGLICTAIAIVLELGAAIGMGMLFPALVAAAKRRAAQPAEVVGSLYLWNTVGSGLGAVMASSLLVPLVGSVWTIILAIFGYLAALTLLGIHTSGIGARRVYLTGVFGAAVAFALVRTDDPLASNLGMYLYGPNKNPSLTNRLVFFQEGRACSVLVSETPDGNLALRVNGKVDASTSQDQQMQLGCAYLPRFLRPDAKAVCVIGLGSGTTAGASLLFPETKVTCFEIEPAVYAASRLFSRINHSPWTSNRFQIVFDDARSAIARSTESYDLIISEPSNPWMAGVSSLYTQDFYERAKRRLRPGGIMVQWVQTYNFTTSEFNLILRTLQGVFPRVALMRISIADTLLVASTDKLVPSAEQLDAAQRLVDSVQDIENDLTEYFGTKDVRTLLLRHFVLDQAGLRRLRASDDEQVVNTDLNMRLEFDAPRQLFRTVIPADQNVAIAIDRAIRAAWFNDCIETWKCSQDQATQLAGVLLSVVNSGNHAGLSQLIEACRRIAPNEPFFQVVERAFEIEPQPAIVASESPLRVLSEPMATIATQLGVRLWEQKNYQEAAGVFRELVAASPQSATSWMNLAINYRALGRNEEAADAARHAMAIDPFNGFVREKGLSFRGPTLENQPDDPAAPLSKSSSTEAAGAFQSGPTSR